MEQKRLILSSKVLLIDLETSPNIAYVWGKYEQDALGDFIRERQVISFAWKWLGENKVRVLSLPRFKTYKRDSNDNGELVRALYKIISSAEVVIGHNVDHFDDKVANTEFVSLGLKPPPPHKTVDTLRVARDVFHFNSNKLDDLGARLGLGKKLPHGGFKLWVGCLEKDMKSWRLMERYNKQDVVLLEKIYLRLRPWMRNHPNLNSIDGHVGCPACKCKEMMSRGWLRVGSGKRRRFQCKACGKWTHGALIKGEWSFR